VIPLAFHTGFLCGHSAVDAVKMVLDAGYEQVELNAETHPWTNPHIDVYTPTAIIDQLAKLGPYSSICVHHDDFGSTHAGARDRADEWTARMVDRACDLGVALIHVIPGSRSDWDGMMHSLDRALQAGGRRGVKVALEPILGRSIAPAAQARKALDALPGLTINFDASHMHVMGDDIVAAAGLLADDVAQIHLKDARGRLDDWAFVELGRGEIDLPGMLRVFRDRGFPGAVSVEHESHIFDGDARPPQQVLKESRDYFDSVMAAL